VERARTSLVRGGRDLAALCRAQLDSVTFRRELRGRLRALLPFDGYCVNTADPQSLLVSSSIGDGLSAGAASRLFELEAEGTDSNQLSSLARGAQHVATIWQATGGDVARSQRMRELFLPLGWVDELRAALVVDRHCWGYLHLFRADKPFTAEEQTQIAALAPLLAAALRAACLRGQCSLTQAPPATLILDRRGEPRAQTTPVTAWLAAFEGDVGGSLPHAVPAAFWRVSASAESSSVEAHYRTPDAGWLSLHASQLRHEVVLQLGGPRARALTELLLLAHGLTERERQVGRLLADGCSNDELAASLGIRRHTVKDHVKAILAKTGCTSRARFAATLNHG
jgi:DNA-binding CsgD family transcriptional regulator